MEKIAKGDEIMEETLKYIKDFLEDPKNKEDFDREKLIRIRGEEDGYKKGEQKGVQKGKNNTTREIARNLISMNLSTNDIVKATGLSINEINKLQKC